MANYFYDMVLPSDMEQVRYIPTIPQFLSWISEKYSDLPALSDGVNQYTYSQMCSRIAKRRTFIDSLGLEKGSHIGIFDRNSVDAIEMFLAVTSSGMVAVNLPAMLPEPAVTGSCRRFDIKAVFAGEALKPACASLEQIGVKVLPVTSMAETETAATEVDKEATATIFFTGGTTGAPKGAVLPQRALMRGSFNGIFAPGKILRCQKTIAMLPLSHVFGLIRGVMGVLYSGGLIYSCEDMKATIGKLPVIRPNILVLVPGLCDTLLGLTKLYGVQFLGGELSMIISGAANVPPCLIAEFDKLGIQLLAGYGLTEGANLTSGNKDVKTLPTSVGKIYPEQETKIVDGELWIRGDNVFTGYYKDEENTRAVLTPDGWLKTGDLVRFDEEGFLYIVGRIKNIIVLSNGENISPESLEEPFYAYPYIKDVLVSEGESAGVKCLAIDIYPRMEALSGKPWEEVESLMTKTVEEVNSKQPSTHQIRKINVRKEDFKRTGSLKVARNQN